MRRSPSLVRDPLQCRRAGHDLRSGALCGWPIRRASLVLQAHSSGCRSAVPIRLQGQGEPQQDASRARPSERLVLSRRSRPLRRRASRGGAGGAGGRARPLGRLRGDPSTRRARSGRDSSLPPPSLRRRHLPLWLRAGATTATGPTSRASRSSTTSTAPPWRRSEKRRSRCRVVTRITSTANGDGVGARLRAEPRHLRALRAGRGRLPPALRAVPPARRRPQLLSRGGPREGSGPGIGQRPVQARRRRRRNRLPVSAASRFRERLAGLPPRCDGVEAVLPSAEAVRSPRDAAARGHSLTTEALGRHNPDVEQPKRGRDMAPPIPTTANVKVVNAHLEPVPVTEAPRQPVQRTVVVTPRRKKKPARRSTRFRRGSAWSSSTSAPRGRWRAAPTK